MPHRTASVSLLHLTALLGAWLAPAVLPGVELPPPDGSSTEFIKGVSLGGALSDIADTSIAIILLREGKELPGHEKLLFIWVDAQLAQAEAVLAMSSAADLRRPELAVLRTQPYADFITGYMQLRDQHHWTSSQAGIEANLRLLAQRITNSCAGGPSGH